MNMWEELHELRKRVSKLSTTAESQAWGTIGIALGYLCWNLWNKHGKPWLTSGQFCLIVYSVAVAAYALTARSFHALKKCLLSARLLFLGEVITDSEYKKMRAKCLKKAGAV
jgi:hypothetical protein